MAQRKRNNTTVSQVNDVYARKNKDTSPLIIKFDRKLTGSIIVKK